MSKLKWVKRKDKYIANTVTGMFIITKVNYKYKLRVISNDDKLFHKLKSAKACAELIEFG